MKYNWIPMFRVGIDQVKDGVDLALDKEMREVKASSVLRLKHKTTLQNGSRLQKFTVHTAVLTTSV